MKRILFASAAVLILTGTARAQYIVHDPGSVASRAAEAVRALQQAMQQYQVMQATLNGLVHTNSVSGLATNALNLASRAPGSISSAMSGLTFGTGQSAGSQQYLNQNRYYTPQGSDFEAQEMQRRAQATANFQAEAQAEMDAVEQRRAGLEQLLPTIDTAPDAQTSLAIQNRVAEEQGFISNERLRISALQVQLAQADRVDQQRAQEAGRQAAEDWEQKTSSAFGAQW